MRSLVTGYVLSLAALIVAVLVRWLLDPIMGDTLPLVTLFGAVAASVWICGYRTAIVVVVLGYIASSYLFIEPRGQLSFDNLANVVGLVAYLFTCALIIVIGEAMRIERSRAAERHELLQVTLRSIGDAVITTDIDGRVTYLNAVAESLTGWAPDAALGRSLGEVFRIINEATRAPVENPAVRALREGVVVGLANHTLLVRKDGTERPIDDSAAAIRDEHGHVSGCVLIFRDVSAQRAMERERASQLLTARLLASIVESSEVAIVRKSLDGIIETWNAAAERLFGYSAEQAVGRHISLVIPRERIAEEEEIITRLKAGLRIEHFETERIRADGRRVLVSLTISPVKDDAGNVVAASKMVRDITRERQAEADREKFTTLVESSTDFIGVCDLDAVPIFVNRAGLELVGLDSVEEARRKTVWDFFFPEDQARIRDELFPAVLAEGHGEIEVRFRNFKTGNACWMMYKVLALIDGAGRPIGYGTVSQDITERKKLENALRELAAHLSEADRRKDEFLATLAHELRSPLAPLANVLEVWKRAEDPKVLALARDTMERQLGQLVRLVDDLLDLNRVTHDRLELRRSRVELSTVIQQAVEACRPLADSYGHELRVSLPAEPAWLNADPARLAQVFGNLVSNACKYTKRGGTIWVRAVREGGEVVVSVKDTGMGIPADKLDSIFDMFMQLDPVGRSHEGLGIGLTLVKRLVLMHGGSVVAASAGVGKGSEFIVRLPVVEAHAPAHAKRDAPEPSSRPPSRRILIVDDNRDSAESLAMLLQLHGNETHVAHDGPTAIEAVEKLRPDVVLLDIGLPKLNGHEVCRRVRAKPWGMDIVLIALTGWGQEDDRRKTEEAGFDAHLVKPVDHARLAEILQSFRPGGFRDAAAKVVGERAQASSHSEKSQPLAKS